MSDLAETFRFIWKLWKSGARPKIEDPMGKCPKCKNAMTRKSHPPNWRPKSGQPYYFAYWDVCDGCRHIQHYEAAKCFVERAPPQIELDLMANVPRRAGPLVTERTDFDWVGEPAPFPGAAPWE